MFSILSQLLQFGNVTTRKQATQTKIFSRTIYMLNAHIETLTPLIKISRDNRNCTKQSLVVNDKYL